MDVYIGSSIVAGNQMLRIQAEKAIRYGLTADQIHNLMNDGINKFSLDQFIAIAKEIGVTVRL